MTARICEHGRQYANCGDCWNNRCDVCDSTLDALDDCLEHGKRDNPSTPMAERVRRENVRKG